MNRLLKSISISMLIGLLLILSLPVIGVFCAIWTGLGRVDVTSSFRDIDPASQRPEDIEIINLLKSDARFELDRIRLVDYKRVTRSTFSGKTDSYQSNEVLVRYQIRDAELLKASKQEARRKKGPPFSITESSIRGAHKFPYPEWWPESYLWTSIDDRLTGSVPIIVDVNRPEFCLFRYYQNKTGRFERGY